MKIVQKIVAFILLTLLMILLIVFADLPLIRTINANANVFLAILTGFYVLFTYWILKTTRSSLLEQNRPYVIVSLPLDDINLMLSIKNFGKRPAFRINVNINPSLEQINTHEFMKKTWPPMLSQTFLAPEQEIRNLIGVAPALLKIEPEKKKFDIEVDYYDSEHNHFNHKYYIDLNSYIFEEAMHIPNIISSLNSISKTLIKLSERIERK
jgi:hypothetical protein